MRIDWILLLYNRPEHSLRVLESLAHNRVQTVHAYLDAPKDTATHDAQKRILEYLNRDWPFELILEQRPKRLGLAKSVAQAMGTAFEDGAEAAVLLEDDCVLKEHGKLFFEQGLQALRHDRSVRTLCGFTNPQCPFAFAHDSDLLRLQRFSTWGWATWPDRWKDYQAVRTVGELLKSSKASDQMIEEFAPDIAVLCRDPDYLEGRIDIWSVPWTLLHYLSDTYAVFPIESVIENIGLDGSGTNCAPTEAFANRTSTTIPNLTYNWARKDYFFQNEDLIRSFMAKHGLKTFPTRAE